MGFIKSKATKDEKKGERKEITSALKKDIEDKILVQLHDFAKQGAWLKWDNVMGLDLSWKTLII